MDRYKVVALLDVATLPGRSATDVEEALAQWRADAAPSSSGGLRVSLTVVASDICEALPIAVQLLETFGRLLSVHVDLEDLLSGAEHSERTGHGTAQSDVGGGPGRAGRPLMVTVELAAELLGISRHQVLERILCGELRHQRGEQGYLLPLDALTVQARGDLASENNSSARRTKGTDDADDSP